MLNGVNIVYDKYENVYCIVTLDGENIGTSIDRNGKDTLFTAFCGENAPRDPWDAKTAEEKEETLKFWENHAIIIPDSAIDWERSKNDGK